MTLHPWTFIPWLVAVLSELLLAVVIVRRRAQVRWPFLLALVVFDVLHSALISFCLGISAGHHLVVPHYKQYFYIYWYGHRLRSLLSLGLLWDVSRAMPLLRFIPARIGLAIASLGFTVTVGSVYLASLHHPVTYRMTADALILRECSIVAWMCLAATLLGSISYLGLGWAREPLNITAGFLVAAVTEITASTLMGHWLSRGQLINTIQTYFDIAVFLFWVQTIYRTPAPATAVSGFDMKRSDTLYAEEKPTV